MDRPRTLSAAGRSRRIGPAGAALLLILLAGACTAAERNAATGRGPATAHLDGANRRCRDRAPGTGGSSTGAGGRDTLSPLCGRIGCDAGCTRARRRRGRRGGSVRSDATRCQGGPPPAALRPLRIGRRDAAPRGTARPLRYGRRALPLVAAGYGRHGEGRGAGRARAARRRRRSDPGPVVRRRGERRRQPRPGAERHRGRLLDRPGGGERRGLSPGPHAARSDQTGLRPRGRERPPADRPAGAGYALRHGGVGRSLGGRGGHGPLAHTGPHLRAGCLRCRRGGARTRRVRPARPGAEGRETGARPPERRRRAPPAEAPRDARHVGHAALRCRAARRWRRPAAAGRAVAPLLRYRPCQDPRARNRPLGRTGHARRGGASGRLVCRPRPGGTAKLRRSLPPGLRRTPGRDRHPCL